ncbi:hypothetical protein OCU04_011579 [Sclerotinia nivalis]|uniref:Uncharacterized protein n=1 Tax=Sclerotinia nivalis TaxID=352851 RepID=A0A9X0AD27_9HELO|nr:hypothetical protein OCU04_011579 [Sclerotinia nivalis]
MVSKNTFEKKRHDLGSELGKKIDCKDLPTEAISILRELYGLRIATTYVDEVERESASRDLTQKDMDGIHKHVLNMKEIFGVCLPPLFLNNLYGIIGSHETKIHEVVSYFLEGRPIAPALLNRKLKDTSQANIMWQIIRLYTLVEKMQNGLVERGEKITSQTNIGKAFWNIGGEMGIGGEASKQSGL